MIFDAHCDIWTDVTVKRQEGHRDIFKKFHLEKFLEGKVNGGIFVIWIDPPHDKDPARRAFEIIENMSVEITENRDIFKIVRKFNDVEDALSAGRMPIVIGCEGLSYIGKNVDLLNTLYMLGARHASLTWNEQNELATGVRGNKDRGLTSYGVEAIRRMEDLGMIVDVSHANEKTFWDIYNVATKPFIASHSNCKALCSAARNLTDEQLLAIKERGGVVGLNAFSDFVSDNKEERDIEHLILHLEHMIKVMGIDHVGFGFDFDDFLSGETVSAFAEDSSAETLGFENVRKVPKLIKMLEQRGFTGEDLEKIKYKNFLRIMETIFK